jgi:hypothetical protein
MSFQPSCINSVPTDGSTVLLGTLMRLISNICFFFSPFNLMFRFLLPRLMRVVDDELKFCVVRERGLS